MKPCVMEERPLLKDSHLCLPEDCSALPRPCGRSSGRSLATHEEGGRPKIWLLSRSLLHVTLHSSKSRMAPFPGPGAAQPLGKQSRWSLCFQERAWGSRGLWAVRPRG